MSPYLSHTPPSASQISHIADLSGPQGPLEAILNTGAPDAPFAAVVCHPYPPAGGTLHNKVVYHAAKAVSALGIPVLRFNFRGVGRSAGTFDFGHGEQQDVQSAVDWLHDRFALPVLLVGFSFGSYVGLRATYADRRICGRVALGLPVRPIAGREYTFDFLQHCPGPLLCVSGDHDEFCPILDLQALLATLPIQPTTVIISGADHFFAGVGKSLESKLPAMREALEHWLLAEFGP